MKSCSLDSGCSRLRLHFGEQCLAQEWQPAEPFDPAEARLDIEQGGGEPAVLLIGGPPVRDLAGPLPDAR
jgi:hypothetical protein